MAKQQLLNQVSSHYQHWTEEVDNRMSRKGGWNDITDAYWGKLPNDWPYDNKIVDPVIRTSLIEKTARLLNSKLRGRLVPRENGDVLKAKINNAVLDFQWDSANYGGSMLSKWQQMDQDTRLYASKFGLVIWKTIKDFKGKLKFDGNEFEPLDIRDCGIDYAASNIKNAKWFQHRKWAYLEDLKLANKNGIEVYTGLSELEEKLANGSNNKDDAYISRIKQLKGLEDMTGKDSAFPMIEIVTEYREDRWITFSPKYNIILRDIKNPYNHGRIPIVQLSYYPLNDDPIGESEVEPVLSLWKAIQAVLNGYFDNLNLHIRPPLKIIEGAARIETIVFGPEAQWIVDRPDAVTEHQGTGEALRYFQTTYTALKSAFNTAMGDFSQGVSNIDPFGSKKTATEVKASATQQNTRDQANQIKLAEAIQDMIAMWLSNNRQFLFSDPKKQSYVVKILGEDMFGYFKRAGLDEMITPPETTDEIANIIQTAGGNVSDMDIEQMVEAGKIPKFPVKTKDGFKPKMEINEMGDQAEISVIPEDVEGDFDYIPDIKSMSAGAAAEQQQSKQKTFELITNPAVQQMLMQQGVKTKIKDLLVDIINDGQNDGERYFEVIQQAGIPGGIIPPEQTSGMPGASNPALGGMPTEQMAGSPDLSQQGQVSAGLPIQQSQSIGI